MPDDATIVLDRYNMVTAYGPLEQYQRVLREGGMREVATWAAPAAPYPHALHYSDEWDEAEAALLAALDWQRKTLRPGDVQLWPGPQSS